MKIKFLYTALLSFVSLIGLSMLLSCSSANSEEEANPAENVDQNQVALTDVQIKNAGITIGEVTENNISSVLKLNGTIEVPPQNIISVSIPMGGYVKHFNLLPGSKVSKGQVLATVEDQQYIQLQQDYLVNKSKLSFAAMEEERQRQLNAGKAGSDKALQLATSEHSSLRINGQSLAEKLRLIGIDPSKLTENNITRQISVRAPINGYVSKVHGNIGRYVNPSDVIFELVNPENIHLSLVVFENDLEKINIGQLATAYSNTDPNKKYDAKVSLITRNLNEDRSVEIHAEFEKQDKTLLPGMYMNADLALNNVKTKSLPDQSIVSFEGKSYVFVETTKNTFLMTPVEIGESDNGYIPVHTDLNGKKIVIKGAYSVLMQLKNIVEEE